MRGFLNRWLPDQQSPAVRWRGSPWWLLAYMVVAAMLLFGWWGDGPLRPFWDQLDRIVFQAMNGGMADSRSIRLFWAITNSRYFDLITGSMILGCFSFYLFEARGRYVVGRFWFGVVMAAFVALWMHEAMKALLDHGRHSPTLVLPDAVRIGQEFGFVPRVKDFSQDSFPGDHFGISLMLGLIMCHVSGWRVGCSLLLIALLMVFPRLAGGGHWFSDQIVGGGFCGLLGAAVFLAPIWWRERASREGNQASGRA